MPDKLSLLLVEDNEDDYILTKQLLGSKAAVTWVASLAAATETLLAARFDAILLDLGLPDGLGPDTINYLTQKIDHIPAIIVLTGLDDDDLAKSLLLSGAQDYLVKGQLTKEILNRTVKYAIERHKVEDQLRRTNEQLRLARDVAIDASRLKSEFLANISHEIRTPLSGIVGMAELLMTEEEPELSKELALNLFESAQRLNRTVNDILDLSKLEAGKMLVRTEVCDVREIIDAVTTTVAPTAKRKKIALTVSVEDGVPPLVVLDKLRVHQVILNFAHNAVKFTSEGEIKISCNFSVNADFAELSIAVADTGIGIPQTSLNDIFQPFVQADGSPSRKYEGSGLGLAICQKSAELLGGEIFVESEEGVGSTFRLTIPVELSKHAH